ncbi:MAG: hypothetical protein ACFFC7_09635 [Candidatus Hermodarchaeota archaeon]
MKILKFCFLGIILFLICRGLALSRPIPVHTSEDTEIHSVLKMQEEISVVRVVFNITTTSDWMTLALIGEEALLSLNLSVLEGEDAPDLSYGVQDSSININKEQFNDTLVNIEITAGLLGLESGTEFALRITKGSIGFSRIEIYNYNLDQTSLVSNVTHWFSEGGTNPFFYYISDSDLLFPDAFFTFEPGQRILKSVLAFYYPWYGNPEWSGEWIHWQDSNHNPNIINNGTRELPSTNYPSLGAYDSNDPSLVRQHIRMAQAAGIDAFISSWWGINSFEDRALSVLLNQAAASNFSVTVYFETAPYWNLNESTASTEILEALRYIYDNYATHPAFYNVELGNKTEPLIFIYVARAWSVEFWQNIITQLRTEGKKMFFQGDSQDSSYLNAFDGIHEYAPLFIPDLAEYYTTGFISARLFENHTGDPKMFASTIGPGFDSTAIHPGSAIVDREGGDLFDNLWNWATSIGTDAILITSFNEWHEGSEIENSREYGGQYLEAVKQWRQLIQPEYVFRGDLTTLNKITDAISIFDWASLVYTDNALLEQVNDTIEASKTNYDSANYVIAFAQAEEAINLILEYSATFSVSSTTTTAPTLTTVADWSFPILFGIIVIIAFKRFRRRIETI